MYQVPHNPKLESLVGSDNKFGMESLLLLLSIGLCGCQMVCASQLQKLFKSAGDGLRPHCRSWRRIQIDTNSLFHFPTIFQMEIENPVCAEYRFVSALPADVTVWGSCSDQMKLMAPE